MGARIRDKPTNQQISLRIHRRCAVHRHQPRARDPYSCTFASGTENEENLADLASVDAASDERGPSLDQRLLRTRPARQDDQIRA